MKNKLRISFIFLLGIFFAVAPYTYVTAVTCETGYAESNGICLPDSAEVELSQKSVADLLSDVVSWMLYFVAFLALIAIVYSGIQYILSAGDDKQAEEAKKNLKTAIIGLMVAITALIVVNTIIEIVGLN